MLDPGAEDLPPIPGKRYFTIGEVGQLCSVKPHVLRYWEQEFPVLKPVKKRGNRRYYQHEDIILIRKIRKLLYKQGFTISGARIKLEQGLAEVEHEPKPLGDVRQGLELDLAPHLAQPLTSTGFDLSAHIKALEQVLTILD